jgi:hypothetical protein
MAAVPPISPRPRVPRARAWPPRWLIEEESLGSFRRVAASSEKLLAAPTTARGLHHRWPSEDQTMIGRLGMGGRPLLRQPRVLEPLPPPHDHLALGFLQVRR